MPYYRNGVQITSARVGDTVTYAVPGFTQIWLVMTKNGLPYYNLSNTVPITDYTFGPQDVGNYVVSAYQLTAQGTRGPLIETTTLTVAAADGGGGILPGPGGTTVGGVDTQTLLLYGGIALVAYFLLRR